VIHELAIWWTLFHDAILVAVLLGGLLPLCGIVLLLRQQVFLSAAVGQAATLGIALGIALGLRVDGGVALSFAIGAGALTAVLAMRALSTGGPQLEATSALLFLLGGAASVLLASRDPHGLEDVKKLTLSSVLGVAPVDVAVAAGALCTSLLLLWRWRHRVLLWATDPVTAQVHGSPLFLFDLAVGGWIGACIGFAIQVTGLLFAFGATVLPVLAARQACRSLRAVWWSAPLLGGAGTLLALASVHLLGQAYPESFDLPPGQSAVAMQCALVLLARPWQLATAALRGKA
jgi:ABC-type Mn2+/Zn2+ transport system permease subunit